MSEREERYTPTTANTDLRCAAPACSGRFALDDYFVLLDFPERIVLAFCGMQCLRVWVMAQGPANGPAMWAITYATSRKPS